MNELQRQHYLSAMGIDTYMPRWQLPFAPAPFACEVASSTTKSHAVSAADILAQLDAKPASIEAFSLSVWRPLDGLMVIDSRNAKMALPTELLLNNILRSFFSHEPLQSREDVLRWPMIENSFTKRTAQDARMELQTWLSVQHEIRPIKHLWLMGPNAAIYFLSEAEHFNDSIFQSVDLADTLIKALILPSLNEILQNPILKQKLFATVRSYHSTNL